MTTLFGWMSSDAQKTKYLFDKYINEHSYSVISGSKQQIGYLLSKKTFREYDVYCNDTVTICVIGNLSWSNTNLSQHILVHGSASSLYQAYKLHGLRLFDFISGHFSFAVIDNSNQTTLLAIDRLGTNSISYSTLPNGEFVFSTDITNIRNYPGVATKLNKQSIYDYLYFHVIPSPETIFEGIHKLEPAQYIIFKNGKIEKNYYWKPVFNSSSNIPEVDLEKQLLDKLAQAVSNCKPTDDTGAFLSGGLDSSTISGVLSTINNGKSETHTFSIGFDEKGYDEIEYAHIASKHFGTIQHDYYVTPDDVANAINDIAVTYEEPYGNSSAIPALFCAQLAKENNMNTLLAGDGGDELFAGNERYAKQKIFDIYQRVPGIFRKHVLEPIFLSNLGTPSLLRKVRSYIQQANLPMPKRMESYNFLNRINIDEFLTPEFHQHIDTSNPDTHLSNIYDRCESDNIVDKMLFLDWKITLADNDLRKVNTMCELAGINVKYPMIDDVLLEFSNTIPANYKLRGQQLRYFYKKSLSGFLPTEIINKPKHGFGLPFGEWLKHSVDLQNLIYDSLTNFASRNIIRPEFIKKIIELHRTGHAAYYGTMVWVIALLELWLSEHDLDL